LYPLAIEIEILIFVFLCEHSRYVGLVFWVERVGSLVLQW
jgi:hypothetical protein